jgi:hypothetical protein
LRKLDFLEKGTYANGFSEGVTPPRWNECAAHWPRRPSLAPQPCPLPARDLQCPGLELPRISGRAKAATTGVGSTGMGLRWNPSQLRRAYFHHPPTRTTGAMVPIASHPYSRAISSLLRRFPLATSIDLHYFRFHINSSALTRRLFLAFAVAHQPFPSRASFPQWSVDISSRRW